MKKLILIFSVGMAVTACKKGAETEGETNFYFDAPQPINNSELSSIPSKFTGTYTSGKDRLIVGEKEIFYEFGLKDTMNMADLDSLGSTVTYKDNKLVFHMEARRQLHL